MTEIPSTPPGDGPASLWKKLGASAEPLRLLTQNSLEILSILDGEGRMLYQSPSIRHVLGYPEEALLGHNVFDYIHPDDRSRLEAQFEQQCARPGATATFQYRFLHADGSWRDFESLTQNLALEPLIGGVVATSRDVTERERAERALRESEERFRAQYRGIPVPTCTWQRRGEAFVLTDCNEAALAYTEGGIHAFMGRTDGELYAEEPRIREMLRRCHATQRILQYDSPCRVRSTGLAREFHVHFVPVPPDLVMVHTEDVTEQRQAERALRQSEERIRHLVETVNVIPWEADPVALRFTYVGPQAVQILGYPLREWYAEDFWTSHLHPDDRERTVELCRDASRRGEDHEVEYRMIAADGRVVWLRDIVSVVREEGETRALRGFLLDITTRKLLEEQLAQSQKMEAVGRLAGGVAHDFNNMLAVINGYSELCLSMLPPESPLSPSLEEIRKAGNRASALTRQLLAFSRKQLLKMQPLDLNDVAQNMSKMLRRLIGDHIDLQYALSPSPACIKADLSQTEQVIMNLVVNARDAMPAGGTLSVAVHAEELRAAAEAVGQMAPPGRYVALSIRDTGAGMEKALIPHIFEPFFTTKPVGEGTGLGLAMVLGIVQQSGGYIQVSSRPGEGTLFRILFPALEQPQVDGSPPAAAPLPGGTETVLLVEDDEAVRGLVRTVLQMHGYTVLEAADAGDALLLCERHRDSIDLVLTDMVMPGLSGNEVVELLREYGAPFKVLYMSGYTDDAVVRRGVLTAEMELIQKPFTPDALARKVRETLDG